MIALLSLAALLLATAIWWLSRPLRSAADVSRISERADLEQLRDRLVAQPNELDSERADRGLDRAAGQHDAVRRCDALDSTLKQRERLAPSLCGATLAHRP